MLIWYISVSKSVCLIDSSWQAEPKQGNDKQREESCVATLNVTAGQYVVSGTVLKNKDGLFADPSCRHVYMLFNVLQWSS